jgi:D-alanyl-D-alanine dipeptidase
MHTLVFAALSAVAPARADLPPDKGIFSDLDERVSIGTRSEIAALGTVVLVDDAHGASWLLVGETPVGLAEPSAFDGLPRVHARTLDGCDADRDGIPDPVDILLGGKKTALDAAPYTGGYVGIPYPNGDVPRDTGVCSDVIVRALRNAGFDLQKLVHDDVLARRSAYPFIKRPDTNIDHRRVRTLRPWFEAHWQKLPPDPADLRTPWLPGDVVFLDTLREPGPDHIGIVSDVEGDGARPFVINSWTDGFKTSEMPLLKFVPVTDRYRVPCRWRGVAAADAGLSGVLARAGLSVPSDSTQVLLVTSVAWDRPWGVLRRYERAGRDYRMVGEPISVNLGSGGLGWGRGIAAAPIGGPAKAEGDGRAPAGVFDLGTAFGYEAKPPAATRWPWRTMEAGDVWVDDPKSAQYNTLQRAGPTRTWASAETMRRSDEQYAIGIVVRHNDAPALAGAGSAIFLHVEERPGAPTTGCTSMARGDLARIVGWLDPSRHPVLVQTVGSVLQ